MPPEVVLIPFGIVFFIVCGLLAWQNNENE
jgi:hypothetical protein